jgi:hypothetical protein
MYPISQYVRMSYNPLETIWFPAVLTEEVALYAVLYSSAGHFSARSGQALDKDIGLLMSAILDRLNRNLRHGKHTDLTLGAISCLALCESSSGNHDRWKLHASGMDEIVRARGGFGNIQNSLHMKLYRADIIGAVDSLAKPHFPRPRRTTLPLALQFLPADVKSTEFLLADLQVKHSLVNAWKNLSNLCGALNYAAENKIVIDPYSFDEDIICVQWDLLQLLPAEQKTPERLCALTALIFIQMLTRDVPYDSYASDRLSRNLKEALSLADIATWPVPLIFWLLFVGGLVSVGTTERQWFRKRLRVFIHMRGELTDWESAKSLLKKVLWVEGIDDPYGKVLWDDVDSSNDSKVAS